MTSRTDGVRRLLVTADDGPRIDLWAATGAFANWLEGRTGRHGTTYLVTVMAPDAEAFLAAARAANADDNTVGTVTVEELRLNAPGRPGESTELLVGAPGQGWESLPHEALPCGCASHDPADHQGDCGHCGAGVDEWCAVNCPVDGAGHDSGYNARREEAQP